ncbi:MAG: lipopolysaccharide assembly protein LapB, partial [Lysobacteraceae bacterium]
MMSPWWLLVLVPAVGAAGWFLGRRGGERRGGARVSRLSATYFRGLNYLLNEQQDKAIEVFLQIAERDKETLETQFTLGTLFRRRGEVDRAIRLHQSVISRPGLSDEQKTRAILALGEDYMRAGLLDRAETLFADLVKMGAAAPQALRHLMSIYQAERDWQQAIDHARRYEAATGEPMGRLIAQFECELAERARIKGDLGLAREHLGRASSADTNSVRASLLEGQIELADGNDAGAIRAYERAARQDIEFLPEALPPLLAAYDRTDDPARARGFLLEMVERYAGVSPALALARRIEAEEGATAALGFLREHLRQRPSIRGEAALIDLALRSESEEPRGLLATLQQINEQLIVRSPG